MAALAAITSAIGWRNILRITMAYRSAKTKAKDLVKQMLYAARDGVVGIYKYGMKPCFKCCYWRACPPLWRCCCGVGGCLYTVKEFCLLPFDSCVKSYQGYESLTVVNEV